MVHESYRHSILRVLLYIEKHLDEKLTLGKLSKVARISRFHFHRIFSSYMGISLGQYIKSKRIEHSVRELALTQSKTLDIALSVGYETHASFNKAFKKEIGLNPSDFKKTIQNKESIMSYLKSKQVQYLHDQNWDLTPILYVRKTGNYFISTKQAWESLLESLDRVGMKTNTQKYIGISHDNPHEKDINEEDLRFDACVVLNKDLQKVKDKLKEQGVLESTVSKGPYAVFKHKGPYETLGDSFHYIYGHWLLAENKKLRDAPPFVLFPELLNNSNIDPRDIVAEIYIPIQ